MHHLPYLFCPNKALHTGLLWAGKGKKMQNRIVNLESENETQTSETEQKVNLGDRVIGEMESEAFDSGKYIGQEAKIANVQECKGLYGYYIKIETELLEIITKKDGTDLYIKASKICGLHENEDKNIGWFKDSALALLLKKYKVQHYRDLVGKKVKVQTIANKKTGKEWLTFI